MKYSLHLASVALAAAMAMSVAAPASAAKAKTLPNCTRNSVSNVDASSGTNSATLGIRTAVHSTTANMSGPPVQNNTPANTNAGNINSNNPGVHQKQDPCKVTTKKHH